MSTYVIGVDGSETAAMAARRAAQLAKATGARVHVVTAYSGSTAGTYIDSGATPITISGLSAAEQAADQQAATFRAAGLDATSAVGEGRAADVLLQAAEAEGAELIVVGNKRTHGLARMLGAVANEVVHHAPCDVLVVKTT